jgi:hypothetical protein
MTAMPGALVSVWADAKGMSKDQQRGFVQPFILAMQIVALALMVATPDVFSKEVLSFLYMALVPLILGTACGLFLYGRCGAAVFRTLVLVIVLCSGSGLLFR